MKNQQSSLIVSVGLAIFSMFFGAGNLMYPIKVGMSSGSNIIFGLSGFFITAILLPLMGLIAMVLFNGNYYAFFYRLGLLPGKFIIFASMIIIGPLIAIPRIVTLSHTMIAPFIPISLLQEVSLTSSFIFSLIFLGVTFLACYKESKIVAILGNFISPLLLGSLLIIIIKGLLAGHQVVGGVLTPFQAFYKNLIVGYETLDLLGGIFFSSIILHILVKTPEGKDMSQNRLALLSLKAGLLGVGLLAAVYLGMSLLGLYYGHGLELVNPGELFRSISFAIMGNQGAAIISIAVLMACLSTSIALAAVVAEYVQRELFNKTISYVQALILVLCAAMQLSIFGLDSVLALTAGVITFVGYPVLVCLTICNLAYKLIGFKPVKIPVLITFIISTIVYYFA